MVKILLVEDNKDVIEAYTRMLRSEQKSEDTASMDEFERMMDGVDEAISFFVNRITGDEQKEPEIEIIVAEDLTHAQRLLTIHKFDLVITDQQFPETEMGKNQECGVRVVETAKKRSPNTTVIWNSTDPANRMEAIKAGADYTFQKPIPIDDMRKIIDYVQATATLTR